MSRKLLLESILGHLALLEQKANALDQAAPLTRNVVGQRADLEIAPHVGFAGPQQLPQARRMGTRGGGQHKIKKQPTPDCQDLS